MQRFSTHALCTQFGVTPRGSVSSLLRSAGPFVASRDAYRFTNSDHGGWAITKNDAQILRERYQGLIEVVMPVGIAAVRHSLEALRFPGIGGLPAVAIALVIDEITEALRNELLDKMVSAVPGRYGRCGGMAFSAYDFFLIGWPVDVFSMQPASGELRQYIWTRLMDSIELNGVQFLEWIMILHILPVISRLASVSLAAVAAGSIVGPGGAVIAALLAGKKDILSLGGPSALRDRTKEHLLEVAKRLKDAACWPVGLVYGDSSNPVDQHQVLAIGYQDLGDGRTQLNIWDNNDGPMCRNLLVDTTGTELSVTSSKGKILNVKGLICEGYRVAIPPNSLRFPNRGNLTTEWNLNVCV